MDESKKKPKTAPKRNTEARREQNRQASRNYREKRKKKLALLNQLLVDGQGETPSQDAGPSQPVNTGLEQPGDELPPAANGVDNVFANTWGDLPDASNLAFSSMLFQDPSFLDGFAPAAPPGPEVLPTTWDSMNFPLSQTALVQTPIIPSSTSLTPFTDQDRDLTFIQLLHSVEALPPQQKKFLLHRLQLQSRRKLPPIDPARTRLQLEAQRFAQALHCAATGLTMPPMPSDYVTQGGFFGALFANCYALGMGSVDDLLVEEGCSVFSLAPDLGYHPSQLSVVRAKFRNLASDLQPVDVQLTFAHHPYLDVLPFKSFRDKALKALDQEPPLLDEDELCMDLCAGGLLCWGSQHDSQLTMEATVPWDCRSWEPKVWFLKKYASLVGGWDDEMWKRTRWWHEMRGERIQELPESSDESDSWRGAQPCV